MPIRAITIVADTSTAHVLPLYSGFRSFARRHCIPVAFRPWGTVRFKEHRPGTLWVEILNQRAEEPLFLCFDMHDSGSEYSLDRLEQCHVYFKRSFDPGQVAQLPLALAAKVRPYGLFCRFGDAADESLLRRFICEARAVGRFRTPVGRLCPPYAVLRKQFSWWLRLLGTSWLDPVSSRTIRKKLVVQECDLMERRASLGNTVFFQTRVWDPRDVPHEKNVAAINEIRADTVRALRDHFGERFVGGLKRDRYATAIYPDLVTPHRDDRLSYLALLQQCRVSVITGGIHQSIPGKLAESLAAGRCIVTEPLAHRLPVPLREGTHYLSFRHPAKCIEQCERLLREDAFAAAMQSVNREYYERHAAAGSTIERCLSVAAAGQVQRGQLTNPRGRPPTTSFETEVTGHQSC